ncbi:GDP-mannose 4,6-dehydratase [Nanoarchaeota archaeon]
MKKALITGITGQDGAYLAEFLVSKGYEVYGMHRRTSMDVFERIGDIKDKVHLVDGDMTDMASLIRILNEVKPDEVYNLASQSFIPASWSQSISTSDITAIGVLKILEAIRLINPKIKFYQASSSEMFGNVKEMPQTENTPFNPNSPYAVSKVYAYWMTKHYRETYNLHASNGILFNHESPKRGKQFVTRKVSHSVAKIKLGHQEYFELGNLNAKRDWGYAGDYVEAMWLMVQKEEPGDYLIASGENHTVREFVEAAFAAVGMSITWEGEGVNEVGKCDGKIVVKVNPKFYRRAEVDVLLGDATKSREILGWRPKTSFKELVKMMVDSDLERLEKTGLMPSDK